MCVCGRGEFLKYLHTPTLGQGLGNTWCIMGYERALSRPVWNAMQRLGMWDGWNVEASHGGRRHTEGGVTRRPAASLRFWDTAQ